MKQFFLIIIFILYVSLVSAIPISYDVTINGVVSDSPFTLTKNEVRDCENTCTFQVPSFETPENFIFSNYVISNPSEQIKSIKFESTNNLTSITFNDNIALEIVELKEELKIGRLITKTLSPGQNNIVLQLENIGNKDLTEVYIQISGDGVKTTGKSTVDIPVAQSDFVTAIVQITNYNDIDIIIKAYSDDKLLGQTIESIYVPPPEVEEPDLPEIKYVDSKYAEEEINKLWSKLNEHEKEFYSKESQEYVIADLTNNFEEMREEIGNLELGYNTLTKEKFDKEIAIISRNLNDIKTQIDFAKPKKFADTIKENLVLIATGLGVLVSALTALTLAKSHLGSKNNKDILKKGKFNKLPNLAKQNRFSNRLNK